MSVTITYCVPCRYERRAQQAAAAIRDQLGLDVELIGGRGGVFRVEADGTPVLSRTKDYFPSTDDIVDALQTRR